MTELYKRAGYLITLTHAPSWEEKFGKEARALRKTGEEEFRKTAEMYIAYDLEQKTRGDRHALYPKVKHALS